MLELTLPDEAATLNLGTQLAALCPHRCIIFLKGVLGAGKTTFVRGLLKGFGYQGLVKSPTYTLVEPYAVKTTQIFHFDLYRLNNPEELHYIGIRDYFAQTAIFLFEWPEQGGDQLPSPDLTCYIEPLDSGRRFQIIANSEVGDSLLRTYLHSR